MKALVFLGERNLEIQDVPKPEGEFIVKVMGSTICGTDLKAYLHGHPQFQPPTILGHEFYGKVEQAPAHTGYKPGDFVVVAPYGDCGKCEACLNNLPEQCVDKSHVSNGSFAEYVAVPAPLVERGVIRLDNPDYVYCLTEPLACVLIALEQMQPRKGDQILVIGGGSMGTLIAMALLDMGVDTYVSEVNAQRRAHLDSWQIPNGTTEEAYKAKRYNKIFVAVNVKELVEEAVARVNDGGMVHVFAGLPKGTMLDLSAADIHYRKVTITGSSGFSLQTFQESHKRIAARPSNYKRLITDFFPLERGGEAFELLVSGDAYKVLITTNLD